MSLGLQLVLSTVIATTPTGCSWAHPGANPYRGDPAHALADFDMPVATRRQLREMMAAHRYTDVATITRDDIVGTRTYTDLREMHSGGGQVCHGGVDRSAWSAQRHERGLVYCAGDVCVIVPTICNNVSLVTREPDRAAALDDSPIDISPSAGPAPAPDTPTATPSDESSPLAFFPTPEGGGEEDESPGGGASGGGGFPGGGFPGGGDLPGGGGAPCCDTGPIGPAPPVTPPASPVPELPAGWLLLAGLAAVAALRAGRR